MAWPTPQDYNEAVQNPHLNFSDAELKIGELELTPMGLPRVTSGAFASVYRVMTGKRDVAVRCFLYNISDQQRRYAAISEFLRSDDLDCTVDFDYVPQGVRVQGAWYPVLKMEWVSGMTLDAWMRANLENSVAVARLRDSFKDMVMQMRRDGIAHGDLQHGNLIVKSDGAIRLVDYDGLFVPALAGLESNETGHRNYQHPLRAKEHFGPYLDNFSAWSIFTSLFCLSRDPSLMQKVKGGDESLLFRQYDYKNPTRSRTFATLEEHDDAEIRSIARKFRSLLSLAPDMVPAIDEEVPEPVDLAEMQLRLKLSINANLPAWMQDGDADGDEEAEIDFRDSLGLDDRVAQRATADQDWPTLSQYIAAMKTPAACFFDNELKHSRGTQIDGRLQPVSRGQNAVFRFDLKTSAFAVKVFLQPDEDRSKRYRDFAKFLNSDEAHEANIHQYIPRVDYQENGIRVGDRIYPIVKMQWIEGKTLDAFEPTPANQAVLQSAKTQFRRLMEAFTRIRLVHGELEPSNLIISPDGLRLIDLDAMLVRNGEAPSAVSNGKYAHPRELSHVDGLSDALPAWIIDTALVVLREQPDLRFLVPKDTSLFQRCDVEDPDNSEILHAMSNSSNTIVRNRAELFRVLVTIDRSSIPTLRIDARIEKTFAKQHNLNFVEISANSVSPDAYIIESDSARLPVKSTEPDRALQWHHVKNVGTAGLIIMALYDFIHVGLVAALIVLIILVCWNLAFKISENSGGGT